MQSTAPFSDPAAGKGVVRPRCGPEHPPEEDPPADGFALLPRKPKPGPPGGMGPWKGGGNEGKIPETPGREECVTVYGYRWYDQVTGRWPSRDPIEQSGGINIYGFGNNSPQKGIDRFGLLWTVPGMPGLREYTPSTFRPNIIEQTIFGPCSGSYLMQEYWFLREDSPEIEQWKKTAIRNINKRIVCEDMTQIVDGIEPSEGNPPQSYIRQVTALGRVIVSIKQPINVAWERHDASSKYSLTSEIVTSDTPGTNPEDGWIYRYLCPGCYDMPVPWGFPIFDHERYVERARFSISGFGDCCK